MAGLPVSIEGAVAIQPKSYRTPPITVPGIGTGTIYATGAAFGTKFMMDVPYRGEIAVAVMLDKDDEGIETDLVLFTKDFTETADHSQFAVSDVDLESFLVSITFSTFKNFANNQVSTAAALGMEYIAPGRKLWAQMVTRGAPTIAVDNLPMVSITIKNASDF